ncbi:MAG: CapA family protein, partial [Traorella sp.]
MKYLKLLLFVFILVGCSQEKERYCKFDGDYQRVVKFSGVGDNLIHGSIYRDAYDGNDYDFSKMYVNVEEDMNQS